MKLRTKLHIDYYVGGTLIALLKPLAILLRRLLRRDHDLRPCRDLTVIKLLGGGSLVIAYPALLAIRRQLPAAKLRLLATPSTAAFGRSLGLFDEVVVIRDTTLRTLVLDGVHALWVLWRADTLLDLEIYSRLTTVFCLLTCTRNRINFYTQESFGRINISTHLLFCHIANGVYHFYDQMARLFGTDAVPMAEASAAFNAVLGLTDSSRDLPAQKHTYEAAVAPCCSDLSRERMLRVEEWVGILAATAARDGLHTLHLLGGPADAAYCDRLKTALAERSPGITVVNAAGQLTLVDSVRRIAQCGRLLAIDSAMLHFARLLGVPTTSYWGPTAPRIMLRPSPLALDVIHYGALPCSPCVHVVSEPPCRGDNLCMRLAVDPDAPVDRNPPWLAQDPTPSAAPTRNAASPTPPAAPG